jgi:hypothetical protein
MIFNYGKFLADLADPADKIFDSYRKKSVLSAKSASKKYKIIVVSGQGVSF